MNVTPSKAEAIFITARRQHKAGVLEPAIRGYRKALKASPRHAHAHYLLGVALIQAKRPSEAIPPLQSAVKLRPDHIQSRCSLGEALEGSGRGTEAVATYNQARDMEPDSVLPMRGLFRILGDREEWEKLLELVTPLRTAQPENLEILGAHLRALNGLNRYSEAALICARFIAERNSTVPDDVFNWLNQLTRKTEMNGAGILETLRNVSDPRVQRIQIRAYLRSGDIGSAIEAFERIRGDDSGPIAVTTRDFADWLQEVQEYKSAEAYLWEIMEADPFDNETLKKLVENALGRARNDVPEKYVEAKELAECLLDRAPESIDSHLVMGNVYNAAFRPELALPFHDKVVQSQPLHGIHSTYLFNLNYDESRDQAAVFVKHREWGQRFQQEVCPAPEEGFTNSPDPKRKLRVGYVSPDLGLHPVGFFLQAPLAGHNPENCEIFLYSNRHEDRDDDKRARELRAIVGEDHWRWTRGLSAKQLRDTVRRDRIDILVDLAGHTSHNRLDVFAHRAAPVQVSWLGYPNTTGLPSIDYRFSDGIVEPEGQADQLSVEKIHRLPNGFHAIPRNLELPEPAPPPCLKRGYITFGSYNNMNKLGARTLSLWARLLERIPNSRLVLKHKSLRVLNNRESLRSRFAMHGIQARRVALRDTTSGHTEHLRSYGDIDIALDPVAYNGTTTTCDALLMGVPVLTLPGQSHASRVSASLMHRIGLDNWVAKSEDHFLEIGALAAQTPGHLASLRQRLRQDFFNSPLGDGPNLARELERAYRTMWCAWCERTAASPAPATT